MILERDARKKIIQAIENPSILADDYYTRVDVVKCDEGVYVPLFLYANNTEEVDLFLSKGTDINITDMQGVSLLIKKIIEGDQHLVKYLIDKGAETNKHSNYYLTPIEICVTQYRNNILADLLECKTGIDINALYKGVIMKNYEALEMMLEKGDGQFLNYEGLNPRDIATDLNDEIALDLFNLYKLDKMLRKNTVKIIDDLKENNGIIIRYESSYDDEYDDDNDFSPYPRKSKKPKIAPLSKEERFERLKNLKTTLNSKIFGQETAIDNIIQLIAGDLLDDNRNKPVVFALFGPSGVGKTATIDELSRALTNQPATVVNMSEYDDKMKASNLLGSAKGYIGSETPGILAEFYHNSPEGVLCLDEFEKADPSVQKQLMNLLDKGTIYDPSIGDLDLTKAVIALTSNAGMVNTKVTGFTATQSKTATVDVNQAMKSFPAEIRGRIAQKIVYSPLKEEHLLSIIDKKMQEFQPFFDQLGVSVTLSDKAKSYFAKKGMHPDEGARPLENLLKTQIKTPVGYEFLIEKAKANDTFYFDLDEKTNTLYHLVNPLPACIKKQKTKLKAKANKGRSR